LSGRRFDSGEDAVGGSLDFDNRFVGFNFEEGLAFDHAIAFLLAPGNELAGFLRHFQCGHYNAEGHSGFFVLGRAPAMAFSLKLPHAQFSR